MRLIKHDDRVMRWRMGGLKRQPKLSVM